MKSDPALFKAPFITREKAWSEADRIRTEFWPEGSVPVDVEIILMRMKVHLEPIQSLREGGDVDALLRGDLTTIMVDADEYMDDRKQNRIRFSLAHELGHLVLHSEVYKDTSHISVEEWIDFVQQVPEDQYGFIELHAYEFAGRLLVPVAKLKPRFEVAVKDAEHSGFTEWEESGDVAREYIANSLSRTFGVSGQVIEKRIIREQLWPPRGGNQ